MVIRPVRVSDSEAGGQLGLFQRDGSSVVAAAWAEEREAARGVVWVVLSVLFADADA
jgi:hypothetical protein